MSLKVFIVSSIRNKNTSIDAVNVIISSLEKNDILVSHEHISLMSQELLEKLPKGNNLDFHKKIFKKIRMSDVIVSECSKESLSVGFLLSYAMEHDKPVVVFQKTGRYSPNLFTYLSEEKQFYIVKYSEIDELQKLVFQYVEYAADNSDCRFNFYLPPDIGAYLKWASKKHKQSKSAFVRNMLQKMMDRDIEYLT